ncbi:MAG: hypothetical protein WD766_15290 [Gemmatimonadota bacterium]
MKADTFAKLMVLDALVEAEIGYLLEHSPPSLELFREGMVARISDLIDEIDVLDSVAAARVYDAIVDFLAELPEDGEGIVETTVRFRRAIDRIVQRGIDRRDLASPSTWAVVLDELLAELADEYHEALSPAGEIRPREFIRVEALLSRTRQAADRMLWEAEAGSPDLADEVDRLTFAIGHRRLHPTTVDLAIRSLQHRASQYRPSTLTRIGAFVLRQVLRRDSARRAETKRRMRERRTQRTRSGDPRRVG